MMTTVLALRWQVDSRVERNLMLRVFVVLRVVVDFGSARATDSNQIITMMIMTMRTSCASASAATVAIIPLEQLHLRLLLLLSLFFGTAATIASTTVTKHALVSINGLLLLLSLFIFLDRRLGDFFGQSWGAATIVIFLSHCVNFVENARLEFEARLAVSHRS